MLEPCGRSDTSATKAVRATWGVGSRRRTSTQSPGRYNANDQRRTPNFIDSGKSRWSARGRRRGGMQHGHSGQHGRRNRAPKPGDDHGLTWRRWQGHGAGAQRAVHGWQHRLCIATIHRLDQHLHRARAGTDQQDVLRLDQRRCDRSTQRQHKPRQHQAQDE